MKKILATLAIVGAASMIAANASTIPTNNFYVGLQGGWAHLSTHNGSSKYQWHGKKNAFVGGLYAGYQFTPYFALEAGTQFTSSVKDKSMNPTAKLNVSIPFTLAAKFDYPIYNKFSGFGEVGFGIAHVRLKDAGVANFSKTRLAPLVELGVEYSITKNVSARLADQYVYRVASHNGMKISQNSVLLGVSYNW